jgi:toxin ParE1/3/4
MKVRWTSRANRDVVEIGDYIAADDVDAAIRWLERLLERVKQASRMPRAGRVVPELGRDDIREVIYGAYRVIYRVELKALVVLAVFEGHRRLPDVDA